MTELAALAEQASKLGARRGGILVDRTGRIRELDFGTEDGMGSTPRSRHSSSSRPIRRLPPRLPVPDAGFGHDAAHGDVVGLRHDRRHRGLIIADTDRDCGCGQ